MNQKQVIADGAGLGRHNGISKQLVTEWIARRPRWGCDASRRRAGSQRGISLSVTFPRHPARAGSRSHASQRGKSRGSGSPRLHRLPIGPSLIILIILVGLKAQILLSALLCCTRWGPWYSPVYMMWCALHYTCSILYDSMRVFCMASPWSNRGF